MSTDSTTTGTEPRDGTPPAAPQPDASQLSSYPAGYTCPPLTTEVMLQHGVVAQLLSAHIQRLREKAFAAFPYPGIALYQFIEFSGGLPSYPRLDSLLSLLRAGGILLDVGCGMGSELRYLRSHSGIPGEQLFGADINPAFIELGHELFMDSPESTGIRQGAADIFDTRPESSWIVRELKGKCAAVHAASFLHLFDWARQVEAALRMVGFLERKKGNFVVGRLAGSRAAGQYRHALGDVWRHTPESFAEMWREVGTRSGLAFDVECTEPEILVFEAPEGEKWSLPAEEQATQFRFCVTVV
ncbi:hypothetical protein BZA05DRAFT_372929 [Tricharina praecox]|uniref:uncharacterized protein n=1 Tax=Tricharina praecox TaxID=43433 RepID=UPI00221ED081|nr:uncharacterized protein BZA05DRAFT_372929 [Tricharina praecox]KAI5853622.1 hypothetical protein BZA05DRAFT_372929 [Tricharina praecox]